MDKSNAQIALFPCSMEEIFERFRTMLQEELNGKMSPEIIDRPELRKRLNLTEPTVIRWEKKGKIPSIRIGSCVRYNWPEVVKALEK